MTIPPGTSSRLRNCDHPGPNAAVAAAEPAYAEAMRLRNSLSTGLAPVIDLAPRWIWKPANLRFIGSHTIHFCYDASGHRTIEFDEREIARGRRVFDPVQEHPSL